MLVHSLLIMLVAGVLLVVGFLLARRARRMPASTAPAPAATHPQGTARPAPPAQEEPRPPTDRETPTGMFG
jgi:hypothetical protein